LEGERLACAASRLIGTRFRLYGRDPANGLDCVGLVFASLLAIGREPVSPQGYRLRNVDTRQWHSFAEASGLFPTLGPLKPGDVVMTSPGPGQQHLQIVEDQKHVIHAHAGLRRVVRQPTASPLVMSAHWRLFSVLEG
jgi:cell wall-associated NlpC family hydrolase